jgi:uncharacterized repeat protein (TIGR03803 family)
MRRRFPFFGLIVSAFLASTPALAQYPTYSVVHSFSNATPYSLMLASDGNFYGYEPSANGGSVYASIFRMTPAGTVSTVYTFQPPNPYQPPIGQLIEAGDGNLYGALAASSGSDGSSTSGAIFSISLTGKYSTVFAFPFNATYGSSGPTATLTLGSDGKLYGLSEGGGATGAGFIFSYDITSSTFTDLHDFDYATEGGAPMGAPLLQGADGNFYGTTSFGGPDSANDGGETGTFFKYSPTSGKLEVLFTGFNTLNSDGANPTGNLIQATNDLFYGTTSGGNGTLDFGTLYTISAKGTFNVVFPFTEDSGGQPVQGVYQATDGNLYGTLATGGAGGETQSAGALYQFTLAGKENSFYSFPQSATAGDASTPQSLLIQGADGNLYGTAEGPSEGVATASGVIFKLAFSPAIAAPIVLTPSASSVAVGSSFNLNWSAANAYSITSQQCYAFIQGSPTGAGIWNGLQTGTYSSSTKLFTGLASITPTTAGTYTYALSCGGVESGFATVTVTGSGKSNSTTTVSATPSAPSVGQPVTLKATVTGPAGTPTGSVQIAADDVSIGSVNLNSSGIGTITASTNGQAPGAYSVFAVYSGDSSYNLSESNTITVTLAKAPTTTALTASPTSVTPPAAVTLTATVKRSAAGAKGTPSGSVTFYANGSVALATVKLNSAGVAALTAPSTGYAPGNYPITAKYLGDSSDSISTSPPVTVTVQ